MKPATFPLHATVEEHHWWFVARRRILVALVDQVLRLQATSTVADLGCGTGANMAALTQKYDAIGIDPSGDAIALARRRFPETEFIRGEVPGEADPIIGQADLVLLTDVLEHVEDDFHLFSHLVGLLASGSHILLTVPANPSLWSSHDVAFGHFRRYTLERLSDLWANLPVSVRLFSFFNSRLYPLLWAARTAKLAAVLRRNAEHGDLRMPPSPLNELLLKIFSGEARRLLTAFDTTPPHGYSRGLSLIAVVRREPEQNGSGQ